MNSIVEFIFSHAESNPSKTALIIDNQEISYKTLTDLIIANLSFLKKKGIKPLDKVTILSGARLSYIVGFFSLQLCKAIPVPLERTIPYNAFEKIREDIDAAFAIADFEVENEKYISMEAMLEEVKNIQVDKKDYENIEFPSDHETANILYTTGTTGVSKGTELTHRNDISVAENVLGFVEAEEDTVLLLPAPLNHAFGIRRMFAGLLNGSTSILIDGVTSVRKFFQVIENYKATAIAMVPTAFEFIFRMTKDKLGEYKDQLRFLDIGAQFLPNTLKENLIRLLPNTRLCNMYGSTEAGVVVGINFNRHRDKIDSIGLDAVNAKIFFVDEDKNIINADSPQNSGALCISGSAVMKGYVNAPELTAQTLINGCVYTNDIGYRDEDGYIYLLGRKGDVINVGGNKVSPEEVEEVVNKHESVIESACVGYKNQKGLSSEIPKLFIVAKDPENFDYTVLKAFLSTHLEQYKIPTEYELIDELPRTSIGKIQRNKLK